MPQGSSAVRPTNGLYLYLYMCFAFAKNIVWLVNVFVSLLSALLPFVTSASFAMCPYIYCEGSTEQVCNSL